MIANLNLSLLVLLLVFCSSFEPLLARSKKKPDVPQLVFETLIHDFGTLKRGQKKSRQFKFQNLGKKAVRVIGTHVSCGCTAARLEKVLYLPGEKGEINVTLDTADFSGAISKSVVVMTSEAHIPERIITLTAQVEEEFLVNPPLLDFGAVLGKELNPPKKRVVISEIDSGIDFELDNIDYNKALFVVDAKKSDTEIFIDVTLKPGTRPNVYKEKILIPNSSQSLSILPIPVLVDIRGVVAFRPDYLDFGQLEFDRQRKRTVTFFASEPFSIKSMVADILVNGRPIDNADKMVQFEVVSDDSDKQKKISVSLNNGLSSHAGALHGRLHFETGELKEKLVVDLYALLLEKKRAR